jgi:hypothetical protein
MYTSLLGGRHTHFVDARSASQLYTMLVLPIPEVPYRDLMMALQNPFPSNTAGEKVCVAVVLPCLQADSLAALLLSLTRLQDVALLLSRLGSKAMARVLYTFLKADGEKVGVVMNKGDQGR